ncbi:hypothetical protein PLEOSDRAFT_1051045 [Pleurotus ostreatus PC15]|uniref:Ketoreductase domain-containing protein n=1 Tax=Pleurotus ostreatus (strain PC15) TaxID=1137138 RepID=A0A067ND91_PLEO1|nr:hypothetical protein PLEOSDRAFT_1051045 [Pleurotus ostreatus PC15]
MGSQQVVLITGCSDGGIGAALVAEFVEKECMVYVTARSLAAMSTLTHENIHKAVLEVTDDESVKALVDHIYGEVGRIDILISNAGVASIGPLLDMSTHNAQEVMNINFLGTVRLVNAVLPRMAKRGQGMFVTIGSLCGELGTPFSGLYNASKAALHAYTETLSQECRPPWDPGHAHKCWPCH